MSIENKLNYLKDTKDLIKNAIIGKGVEVTPDTPFREYADKINEISGGAVVPPIDKVSLEPINKTIVPFSNAVSVTTKFDATDFAGSKIGILPTKTLKSYEFNFHLKLLNTKSNSATLIKVQLSDGSETSLKVQKTSGYCRYYAYLWKNNKETAFTGELIDPKASTGELSEVYVKYRFESDYIYIDISFDKVNYTTMSIYSSGIGNLLLDSEQKVSLFGDSGWDLSRTCEGIIYEEDTYIKDIDTDTIVWKLFKDPVKKIYVRDGSLYIEKGTTLSVTDSSSGTVYNYTLPEDISTSTSTATTVTLSDGAKVNIRPTLSTYVSDYNIPTFRYALSDGSTTTTSFTSGYNTLTNLNLGGISGNMRLQLLAFNFNSAAGNGLNAIQLYTNIVWSSVEGVYLHDYGTDTAPGGCERYKLNTTEKLSDTDIKLNHTLSSNKINLYLSSNSELDLQEGHTYLIYAVGKINSSVYTLQRTSFTICKRELVEYYDQDLYVKDASLMWQGSPEWDIYINNTSSNKVLGLAAYNQTDNWYSAKPY